MVWRLEHLTKTRLESGAKILESYFDHKNAFSGKIEADDTYTGGLENNKHADKQLNADRGDAGALAGRQ